MVGRFLGTTSQWADRLENAVGRWAPWLTYHYWGDPASWFISHPFFTALGGLVAWPFTHPAVGCAVMVGFYVVREAHGALDSYRGVGWPGAFRSLSRNPHIRPQAVQVGWMVDGICDVLGPAALTALVWWLL